MVNLTAKELTALEDQIGHEQTLVKKYNAMACLCNDQQMCNDFHCYANKHQQHCEALLAFLR